MLKAFYILGIDGTILVSRIFRNEISSQIERQFKAYLLSSRTSQYPLVTIGNLTFCHIKKNNVFFVGVVVPFSNMMTVFSFLHQVPVLLEEFLRREPTQRAILQNIVLVQEVIDDVIDFGYAQTTDEKVLSLLITQKGYRTDVSSEEQQKVTVQATGVVSHRKPGITYKRNEIFIKLVEEVNALIGPGGQTIMAFSAGKIFINSRLSGMPTVKLMLSDRFMQTDRSADVAERERYGAARSGAHQKGSIASIVRLDDVRFHTCVRISDFEETRNVTFIPPDGKFRLMEYRITEAINIPFTVTPIVTAHSETRVGIRVQIASNFDSAKTTDKFMLRIPVPDNVASTEITTSLGKAKLEPERGCITWRISKFAGETMHWISVEMRLIAKAVIRNSAAVESNPAEPELGTTAGAMSSSEAQGGLSGVRSREASLPSWRNRDPISLSFVLPGYSSSGFTVKQCSVLEKTGYKTNAALKIVCEAGKFDVKF